MSMNTPLGRFMSIKNIKDFETVEGFNSTQYILGVSDEIIGTGIKTTLNDFVVSAINAKGAPAITNYSNDITYNEGQWVLDNGIIYKSLADDNIGHETADTNYWEKVQLGGGSSSGAGLEVCDIATALYIDETKGLRRYLNGSTVAINQNTQAFLDRLKEIRTLHPEYFTDEQTWQSEATLNVDGCVYKFVIDEVARTIRLPKYPEYVEVTKDNIPVVGNGTSIGYTNGIQNFTAFDAPAINNNGAHYHNVANYGRSVGTACTLTGTYFTGNKSIGLTTDSSKSGVETSSDSVTKLKLRYFIQIATGQETQVDIVNKIELNNPYSFGDCKYTEVELNNLSWLYSQGQWNSKAVYVDYYNWILTNANNNVDKFKKSTDEYTDYDWVVDTSNETFRLPIKTNLASGKAVVGNGTSVGLTDGTNNLGMTLSSGGFSVEVGRNKYNVNLPNTTTRSEIGLGSGALGITTDATKSGMELTDSNLYLYYYVGETVKNANLIDAGRIAEQLTGLVEVNPMIDSYVNGTSGYNIWANGYCEQWGAYVSTKSSGEGLEVVSLLKQYTDVNYVVTTTINPLETRTTTWTWQPYVSGKQVQSFKLYTIGTSSANCVYWVARGYLAKGEY